jgi:hypothetical protein
LGDLNFKLSVPDSVCPGGRSLLVVGTRDDPGVVLAGLGVLLGYVNAYDIGRWLRPDEKGHVLVETTSGIQRMLYANRKGLGTIFERSRKPYVKAVRQWLFHDILPGIIGLGCRPSPEATPPAGAAVSAAGSLPHWPLNGVQGPVRQADPLSCTTTSPAGGLSPMRTLVQQQGEMLQQQMAMLQLVDGMLAEQERQAAFGAETRAVADRAIEKIGEVEVKVDGGIAEARSEVVEARVEAAEARGVASAAFKAVSGNHGYMTILAYCKINNIEVDEDDASQMGKKVSAHCRKHSIEIKRIFHKKYGFINTYPESAILAALGGAA